MTEPTPSALAIVGRPNVGKSALFNRLVGSRVSIVHEQPGVTRDRVVREAEWHERRFTVIDTGGLGFMDGGGTAGGDPFAGAIRDQVEAAITDAAVILFVTDCTSGVTPLDEEVAKRLHASGLKVYLAANKADNERVDQLATEFEKLGFPVYPVSALHNRGFEPLLGAVTKHLPQKPPATPEDALKVAVVGKPNAGKSSFLNRILRNDRLVVSDVPGTTRDAVEMPFEIGTGPTARKYLLIDTAGLRHIRKALNAVEKFSIIRAQETIERADVVVLMIDAETGPTLQDKKIAAMVIEHRKGCFMVLNKWDLMEERTTQREYEAALREHLPFLTFAPILFLSSKSGYNIRRSIDMIDHVAAQNMLHLSTGTLNRVMRDAMAKVQPPMVAGKRMKLYYATQTGVKPVRIRCFVNETTRLTDAYKAYLTACLRKAYGLEGAPVLLEFRSSHGDEDQKEEQAPREGRKGRPRRRTARRTPKRGRR
jgi:GTP-binding protein